MAEALLYRYAEDTMRSVVLAASLFAATLLLTPAQAAAQDPETPPPPPPPPAQVAAPRAPDPSPVRESPRGEVRSPRFRETETDAPVNRGAGPERSERAVERPVRTPVADVSGTPAAASSEDQGGRPRGSVRRPPSDSGGSRPVDRAVPRSQAPPPPQTRTTVVRSYPYRNYPRSSIYFDPWGYGSFGVGYFYYSPWAWAPYSNYGYGYGSAYPYPRYGGAFGFDVGAVKIKVKPRDAEVWVDGYYAGSVDDFDGMFQSLRLDSGAYRIEVRKSGFETLTFDVRVQPERTITFRGELNPKP
jgi:hypothetical protein